MGTDPVTSFRRRAVDVMALVLGGLAMPSALVNAIQSYGRPDPYLGVTAVVYLVCGLLLLAMRFRPDPDVDIRTPFMGTTAVLVLGGSLTETPAGASHMLGITCVLLVLLGHLTAGAKGRARWHVVGSLAFPGVVLLRQLYRPHPLLDDPLELLPQAAAGGLAVYGIGMIVDRAIGAFAEQAQRARDAEAAKDRFLQNMSHELRTPLTAIVGYAELLAEEGFEDPEVALEDLRQIRGSSNHLLGIIDDLLDLSRLGHRKDRIEVAPIALSAVIDAALVDVRPQIDANGNALEVQPTSLQAMAEDTALRRILVNLLGNAAKFTKDGTITVSVREDGDRVVLEIQDTGIGFPEHLTEHIFQPFEQVDDTSTRVHGGAGLGLAISRGLAKAMGGTLEAHARPGQGATFRLTLEAVRP